MKLLKDLLYGVRIQEIVGSLLYYARAVDNKLFVALSAIAACQAKSTIATEIAVNHLLDYVETYPNDGIIYRASNMILATHSDAGCNNQSKARSRAGAHIFLSEDDAIPGHNGPVLSISQIIKNLSWPLHRKLNLRPSTHLPVK